MGLTVTELQARVKADTSDAERAFANLESAQKRLISSSNDLANKISETGDKIDESAKKSGQSWEDFGKTLNSVAGRITTLGAGLSIAITAPIIGLGKEALNTAVRFDSLQRGLTAVMHSSSLARNEFTKLREVARLPGLGMEEALEGSIRLQAAGLSAEQTRKTLIAFANALATVGKGKADLEGVTLALTEMASTQEPLGRQIRMLLIRVPQIRQIMLDAFGSADPMILQRAKVTSQDFIKIITDELSKLPKITTGVRNDLENLQDHWKLTLNQMGIALFPFVKLVSDTLVPVFHKITNELKSMSPEQKDFLVWGALAVAAIGPLLVTLGTLSFTLTNLIALWGLLAPLVTGLGTVIVTLATGPVGIIIAALGVLYLAWKNNWGGMHDLLNNVFSSMEESFTDWSKFAVDTWKEWQIKTTQLLTEYGPVIIPILNALKTAWDAIWFAIGGTVTIVFTAIEDTIDVALSLIRVSITTGLDILKGDWKGVWDDIENISKTTWDNIVKHTESTTQKLTDKISTWWDSMNKKANEQGGWFHAPGAQPITQSSTSYELPTSGFGLIPHQNISPMHTFTDDEMASLGKKWANHPVINTGISPLPPASPNTDWSAIQNTYKKRVADILNTPKKTKLTDEQREELSFTKELNDAKAQLAALRNGDTKAMADELGQYNLLNPEKVKELGIVKQEIQTELDRIKTKKDSIKAMADERTNFHDTVKATEAAIRDLKAGNKDNSLANQFPDISKGLIKYESDAKAYQKYLQDSRDENNRFKESLKDVNSQIQDLLNGNGMASLRAEFKGFVSDDDLKKLNDAKVKLKALQELQNANDKLTLLQMPKPEREAATAVGLDMWRNMTDEAKKNTLAIFANIDAQNAWAKALDKANEAANNRVSVLSNFVETMQDRLKAAQSNISGDTAMGAWEKLLAGSDSLKTALDLSPDSTKTQAMKMFFDVFNAEANAKKIQETADALSRFNTQIDENIKLSQLRLQGQGDSVEAKWQEFLLNNEKLSNKFVNDTDAERKAFEKFKQSFNLDEQATYLKQFQSDMGDLRKQFLLLTTTDPFEQYKISLMEIKNGNLTQVFTDDQLKEMFKLQTINDIATQLQDIFTNAISNLKDGFGAFFSSIVQGFEKMLADMAAKWLASQLVNLIVRVVGGVFGVDTNALQGKAVGGPVSSGRAYIVGERGPELFVPANTGTIIPNDKMQGGDIHNHMTWVINTPDVAGVRKSRNQIQRDAIGLLGTGNIYGRSKRGWG